MKPLIIPTILVPNGEEALSKIRVVADAAPWVQIDVCDETLAPNQCWHDATDLMHADIKPSIELHLMVNDPRPIIEAWRSIPNFQRAVWHVEAPIDHQSLIDDCHAWGLEAGLAIFPETGTSRLGDFLPHLDTALVLGVHPGFSGGQIIPETLEHVRSLHALAPKLPIGFDGGIRPPLFADLEKAGASYLYMGSFIFRDEDPASLISTQQAYLDSMFIPPPVELR